MPSLPDPLVAEDRREDQQQDDREHDREEDGGRIAPEDLLVVAELVEEQGHSRSAPLPLGRVRLGQLQVDVLEARPPHFQVLELLAPGERLGGQLVEGLDRRRRLQRDLLAAAPVGDPARLGVAVAEVLGRPARDHLAAGDDRDPVGEALRLVHVVGGEEDGLAEVAQGGDRLPGLAPRLRVEAGGRLVEEEQLRIADQRHADVEAALLPAGELAGARVRLALEADRVDHLLDRSRPAVVAGEQRERLGDGQVGVEAAALQDDPDPLAPGAAGRAADPRRGPSTSPAVAIAVSLEDLDRGRLAGAVGPEEGEDLPRPHLEVDPAHGLDVAVAACAGR